MPQKVIVIHDGEVYKFYAKDFPAQLLRETFRLLRRRFYEISKIMGIEYADLQQEYALELIRKVHKYNPDKGSWRTYCHIVLTTFYMDLFRCTKKHRSELTEEFVLKYEINYFEGGSYEKD